MMVMAAPVSPADCLRQILDVRQLAGLRGGSKIRGKLCELTGRAGVAVRCRGLGCGGQIGGNLLRHLRILRWIRLLKLLESA